MEFQERFATDAACLDYLAGSRWPEGFICPTHRGVSKEHLPVYLDEFVFRHNRRGAPMAAFQTLLGLGAIQDPTTYDEITALSHAA
jgi:Transposase zinc-ribbon domain